MSYHLPRPQATEHHEYYSTYIDLVPDGDILETLRRQLGDTLALLDGLTEEHEKMRYAEDKWSIREIIGHLLDSERVFAFRALVMAREDGVDLPGMDQDRWAVRNNAHERPLAELLEEWKTVRRGNVHLFATFDEETGLRTGNASGRRFSVRTFPWLIAGHELHHRAVISERYLIGG